MLESELKDQKKLAQAQLTHWRCHKIVQAGYIVERLDFEGGAHLCIDQIREGIAVDAVFLQRHNPQIGQCYVLYEDGYESISPAGSFEAGYSEVGSIPHTAITEIAEQAHEMNRLYCEALGDNSQVKWADADEWQKKSAVTGVTAVLHSIDSTSEDLHNSWTLGDVKDGIARTHPCMVPYDQLPADQQFKDHLFRSFVTLNLQLYGAL